MKNIMLTLMANVMVIFGPMIDIIGRKSTICANKPPMPLISMHIVFSTFVGADVGSR